MNSAVKITLSAKEQELIGNTEWILTKQSIIHKTCSLFGQLQPGYQNSMLAHKSKLPEEVFTNAPKISRGENYRQLPYVMLDYPRYFGKEDTIAIRTFFWWGNFFSISLQLSGKFLAAAKPALLLGFEQLGVNGYYVCVHSSPWEHYFEADNFLPIQAMSQNEFATVLAGRPFIKISRKFDVNNWEQAPEILQNSFATFIQLCSGFKHPAGEKDL